MMTGCTGYMGAGQQYGYFYQPVALDAELLMRSLLNRHEQENVLTQLRGRVIELSCQDQACHFSSPLVWWD